MVEQYVFIDGSMYVCVYVCMASACGGVELLVERVVDAVACVTGLRESERFVLIRKALVVKQGLALKLFALSVQLRVSE